MQKVQLGQCSQHSDVRKVAIISSQSGKFTKDSNLSLFELACQPCIDVLKDSPIYKDNIDAVILSSCCTDQYSSSILCEYLGIRSEEHTSELQSRQYLVRRLLLEKKKLT